MLDVKNSETIEVMQSEKKTPAIINFDEKISNLLDKNQPTESVIRKKFYSRLQSEHKELTLPNSSSLTTKKSKLLEWSDRDGFKHFNFGIQEIIVPVTMEGKKKLSKYKNAFDKAVSKARK